MNDTSQQTIISIRSFLTALVVLIILVIAAGILTQIVPQGAYERIPYTVDQARKVLSSESEPATDADVEAFIAKSGLSIVPNSFHYTGNERLPIWRWFTAPVEVLFADGNIIVIGIIVFIMIVGGSIKVLDRAEIIPSAISIIVQRFKHKRYILMALMILVFMGLGAFLGLYEEVVPLVPIIVVLARQLGWNTYIGLGFSVVATGLGFAVAITNPFTLGVAQNLAGIPVFSGALFRFGLFIITYLVFLLFMFSKAHALEKKQSPLTIRSVPEAYIAQHDNYRGVIWFAALIIIMVGISLLSPLSETLSDASIAIRTVLFLIAGIGGSLLSGVSFGKTMKVFLSGTLELSPAILLVLLATAIKHIILSGGIMDTILHEAESLMTGTSSFGAILLIYLLVLLLKFFVSSGSAKAFIVIPLVCPILDMLYIPRQIGVLAFQFGDGIGDIFYPTNAVLLIALGLASASYVSYFRWIFKLIIILFALTAAFLWLALATGYC